jgi:hypothetical protein
LSFALLELNLSGNEIAFTISPLAGLEPEIIAKNRLHASESIDFLKVVYLAGDK